MTMQRLDPSDPADLQKLVDSGLIWNRSVPAEYKQMAVDGLADGSVTLPDMGLPPDVVAEVNQKRNLQGKPPLDGTPDAANAPVETPQTTTPEVPQAAPVEVPPAEGEVPGA